MAAALEYVRALISQMPTGKTLMTPDDALAIEAAKQFLRKPSASETGD